MARAEKVRMIFNIENNIWDELIRSFESKRYPNYCDEKVYNAWDLPLEKINPNILKMIFDLHKRIRELEYKIKCLEKQAEELSHD